MPDFSNGVSTPSTIQTHATDLDGTVGRGLFSFTYASEIQTLLAKSDVACDWLFELEIFDPLNNSLRSTILSASAVANVLWTPNIKVPAGSKLYVTTTVTTNPSVLIVTSILREIR